MLKKKRQLKLQGILFLVRGGLDSVVLHEKTVRGPPQPPPRTFVGEVSQTRLHLPQQIHITMQLAAIGSG